MTRKKFYFSLVRLTIIIGKGIDRQDEGCDRCSQEETPKESGG
jgi:hypothetical protein